MHKRGCPIDIKSEQIHTPGAWTFRSRPGPWFNIKMSSYQYRKSHCGDKTVVRSSYLHNGISYTGKMSSLYWIGAQCFIRFLNSEMDSQLLKCTGKIFHTCERVDSEGFITSVFQNDIIAGYLVPENKRTNLSDRSWIFSIISILFLPKKKRSVNWNLRQ